MLHCDHLAVAYNKCNNESIIPHCAFFLEPYTLRQNSITTAHLLKGQRPLLGKIGETETESRNTPFSVKSLGTSSDETLPLEQPCYL